MCWVGGVGDRIWSRVEVIVFSEGSGGSEMGDRERYWGLVWGWDARGRRWVGVVCWGLGSIE